MQSVVTHSRNLEEEVLVIEESIGNRIGAVKDLARHLIGEVEALETSKNLDISRGINIYEEVRQYETALIRRALRFTGGNQKKAATLLGLLPSTLNDKIKRYQISY